MCSDVNLQNINGLSSYLKHLNMPIAIKISTLFCSNTRLTFEQVLVEEYEFFNGFAVSVDKAISHRTLQVENLKKKRK